MRIAVAGGTGRLGRHLVDALTEAGHDAAPFSRTTGVDVVTGEGLAAALKGADVLVDAATGPSPDRDEAAAFFRAAVANLRQAGADAGVQRVVVVSIIGPTGSRRATPRPRRTRNGRGWTGRSPCASCARTCSTSSSSP